MAKIDQEIEYLRTWDTEYIWKVLGKEGVKALAEELVQHRIDEEHIHGLEKLLKTGYNQRLRSDFRKSLYTQVCMWRVKSDAGEQVHRTPLSLKQMDTLLPWKRRF